MGLGAQGPDDPPCVEDDRRAESLGQSQCLRVLQISSEMGQVRAVAGTGVEIDAVGAQRDHLAEEEVRQSRRERACRTAREAAVQVAAVR